MNNGEAEAHNMFFLAEPPSVLRVLGADLGVSQNWGYHFGGSHNKDDRALD